MNDDVNLYKLLSARYPTSECVIMKEVSNASGFARSRSLDWMIVNLWPSRGLAMIGIEVKSWRADWLKELKNPEKQESHFKYCDNFYLLTTEPDIAKLEEIPATWGWMTVKNGKLVTMKEAPKQTPVGVDRSFLCAMLRRAASKEEWVHKDSIQDRIDDDIERATSNVQRNLDDANEKINKLREKIAKFEQASGIEIGAYRYANNQAEVGAAVKFVLAGGIEQFEKRLKQLKESAAKIESDISGHLKSMNLINVEKEVVNG